MSAARDALVREVVEAMMTTPGCELNDCEGGEGGCPECIENAARAAIRAVGEAACSSVASLAADGEATVAAAFGASYDAIRDLTGAGDA